ncbi:MAG: nucleotide exchange factor GrpE [Phycisphaerae bacterium]|jgi:molecular chaperone GrpE|nr:nucleotide exchange factor GrpE [Phycisphaerae bacterium]|tara:strand:- start:1488 stop:1994 length:507 start_codon:yes stop_codon:yes gene_type:complete
MMTNPNTSEDRSNQDEDIVEEQLSEVDQLQLDLEEANEAKLRALADFKNYQRRSAENEIRSTSSGKAQVVRAIVPSIEQMNMAIEHTEDAAVAQGFQMARDAMLQGLAECGVTSIKPELGDIFDPQLHEALMRQDSDDYDSDHIVMVMQTGFQLGDIIITPAKVAVSS